MSDDRFISPCPPPTDHQREIATILVEECAEIFEAAARAQQRATKLLRFGVEEVQHDQPYTNAERLSHEVGDLLEMIDRAMAAGILSLEAVEYGREKKRKQLSKYLQTALYDGAEDDRDFAVTFRPFVDRLITLAETLESRGLVEMRDTKMGSVLAFLEKALDPPTSDMAQALSNLVAHHDAHGSPPSGPDYGMAGDADRQAMRAAAVMHRGFAASLREVLALVDKEKAA